MILIARGNHAVGGTAARVKYLRKHPPTVDSRPFEVSPDFWACWRRFPLVARSEFRSAAGCWRDDLSARDSKAPIGPLDARHAGAAQHRRPPHRRRVNRRWRHRDVPHQRGTASGFRSLRHRPRRHRVPLLDISETAWHASQLHRISVGIEHAAIAGAPGEPMPSRASGALVACCARRWASPATGRTSTHNEASPADGHTLCCSGALDPDRVVMMAGGTV